MAVAGSVLPGAVGAFSASPQNGGLATMGAACCRKWGGCSREPMAGVGYGCRRRSWHVLSFRVNHASDVGGMALVTRQLRGQGVTLGTQCSRPLESGFGVILSQP